MDMERWNGWILMRKSPLWTCEHGVFWTLCPDFQRFVDKLMEKHPDWEKWEAQEYMVLEVIRAISELN